MGNNVKLNYTSTLEGSALILTCASKMSNNSTTDEKIFDVICHSNGSWIPDPADFIDSCSPVSGTNFEIMKIYYVDVN